MAVFLSIFGVQVYLERRIVTRSTRNVRKIENADKGCSELISRSLERRMLTTLLLEGKRRFEVRFP